MGVPKFFRYTSERYPCLNELVKQYQIPEFDNMYLDMNGIIHNCSHPDDSNPHFRITEEKIFADIFHYLSILFQIIKPKKLFFMAIDGVAPRAKMNQQRGRRFRSAREAEQLEEKARRNGETLPSEKRFDSNCITPGTVFMARLHEQLRYFVRYKISTDPLWSKCRVVLSGHETPGEGEHKIMDYIRWARSQPDYDPDTRHCLYGLDADLIMLGMCTHEPHFALLREEVKFGKSTQRTTSPEETNFYLLHLSLMRDYLEQEFLPVRDKIAFEWDLEKIVDDWVLMGFLVGNDFIPNLPNMHISNDAMPILYKTYMAVLPTLDGYINECGVLNLARFETFMQELAKVDREAFQETYVDLKYFAEKTGRRPNTSERKEYKPNNDETFNVDVEEIKSGKDDELAALIAATDEMLLEMEEDDADSDYEDISDEEADFANEFALHKKDYYMNKLDYAKVTSEVLASQAECYVRAIQWNLHYYYRGCVSWCWYYPHHYAPFISDICGFRDLKLEFELGEPFKPFEQLLAVLPAASKALLPEPFHHLMTEEKSPIFDYYPIEFDTDLNGKKNDWEAVVLIPFIDEKKLLEAMKPCYEKLTPVEVKRNTHGPMLIYNYSQMSLGPLESPEYYARIEECHCSELSMWRNELDVPPEKLKRGVLPGAHRLFYYPGFPTLQHLKYKTYLKKNKCRVFDQPSRNDNMIIELPETDPLLTLKEAAMTLLGRVVWVGWPHLTQAKVISVSDENQRYHLTGCEDKSDTEEACLGFEIEANEGDSHKKWLAQRATIIEHNMGRLGIELGQVKVIVHAVNLKGHRYVAENNTSLAVERVWCEVPCGYAYQTVLKEVKYKSSALKRNPTPQEVFPPGAGVFLITGPYYGCLAHVVSAEDVKRTGRVRVRVNAGDEPRPTLARSKGTTQYRGVNHVAAASGITTHLLSRLTGCVFVVLGERNNMPTENVNKLNIGLNLKFNKKNQEVSGFTRRCPMTGQWLYSQRCSELVSSYVRKFPNVIDALTSSISHDIFFEGDLWPGQVGQGKPQEVVDWIKQQPHATATRRDCGSEALEPEDMLRLAESIDKQLTELTNKEITLQVKIGLVYVPSIHEGNVPPDPKADYQLYDRVVCAASNLTVPMGACGTITAVYRPTPANTVRLSDKLNTEPSFQILFDVPFAGAMSEELFTQKRFYRLSGCHLLNVSFGRKLREKPAHQIDAFGGRHQPSLDQSQNNRKLRTDDGYNSAFASYSPTKERNTPSAMISSLPSTADLQENSTEFLRSLLKISQPISQQGEQPSNWRARPDPNTAKPQQTNTQTSQNASPQRPQQQNRNWRLEPRQNPAPPVQIAPQRPECNVANVFNNQIAHNAPPPPRFPPPPSLRPARTYSMPQSNAPRYTAYQQNVPLQPFFDNRHAPFANQSAPFVSQPAPFVSQHTPFVSQPAPFVSQSAPFVSQPAPFQTQATPFVSPHAPLQRHHQRAQVMSRPSQPNQPANNPFVPLQVVAKHRKAQKPASTQPDVQQDSAPSAAMDVPCKQSAPPQGQSQVTEKKAKNSKTPRKPRSRIAANLPVF